MGKISLTRKRMSIALRRRVGMVFARPVVLPMTIRQNLTYGLELANEKRRSRLDEAVERSLKLAALWDEVKDRLNDPAIALSGGQQQRLCLARVLANQPEVILLDEPTSGLDPISTGKVETALQELKKDYTIILVPHSVQQAARVADFAVFFLQGELVEAAEGRNSLRIPRKNKPKIISKDALVECVWISSRSIFQLLSGLLRGRGSRTSQKSKMRGNQPANCRDHEGGLKAGRLGNPAADQRGNDGEGRHQRIR